MGPVRDIAWLLTRTLSNQTNKQTNKSQTCCREQHQISVVYDLFPIQPNSAQTRVVHLICMQWHGQTDRQTRQISNTESFFKGLYRYDCVTPLSRPMNARQECVSLLHLHTQIRRLTILGHRWHAIAQSNATQANFGQGNLVLTWSRDTDPSTSLFAHSPYPSNLIFLLHTAATAATT